jgi:hypothetical protein
MVLMIALRVLEKAQGSAQALVVQRGYSRVSAYWPYPALVPWLPPVGWQQLHSARRLVLPQGASWVP